MTRALVAQWTWEAPKLPVDSWWFLGVVLVVLVFFIWLIARLTTTVTDDIDPAEIDRQMLTAVNELHSQGDLTAEEYRSIKGRLVVRLSDKPTGADSEDSSQQEQLEQHSEGPIPRTTEKPEGEQSSLDKSDLMPDQTQTDQGDTL